MIPKVETITRALIHRPNEYILPSFSEFSLMRNINPSDVGVGHLVFLHCANFANAFAGAYQIVYFLVAVPVVEAGHF
jgi:hypothetical protein